MRCCVICADECSWTNDQAYFYGGVTTHLCANCITDITSDMQNSKEWQSVIQIDAIEEHQKMRAWAQDVPPLEEIEEAQRLRYESKKLCHSFVKLKILERAREAGAVKADS